MVYFGTVHIFLKHSKTVARQRKPYKVLPTHWSSSPKTEFLTDTMNGNMLTFHSFIQKSWLPLPICNTCSDHRTLDLIWHLSSNEVEALTRELEMVCVIRLWQPEECFFGGGNVAYPQKSIPFAIAELFLKFFHIKIRT